MAALLASANRLGWRRPVRAARRCSPALEGGDAAIVKLRALQWPAFLRHALLAERGVRAQQPFVLLALANILLGALAGRRGESEMGGDHHNGGETAWKQFRHGRALRVRGLDRPGGNNGLAKMRRDQSTIAQSTIVRPPLTLNTWPVM